MPTAPTHPPCAPLVQENGALFPDVMVLPPALPASHHLPLKPPTSHEIPLGGALPADTLPPCPRPSARGHSRRGAPCAGPAGTGSIHSFLVLTLLEGTCPSGWCTCAPLDLPSLTPGCLQEPLAVARAMNLRQDRVSCTWQSRSELAQANTRCGWTGDSPEAFQSRCLRPPSRPHAKCMGRGP